jgi:hypothetical protein
MSNDPPKCLLEHTPNDHPIDLKTIKTPPSEPCYALSDKELEVPENSSRNCLGLAKLDSQNPLGLRQYY